MTYTKALKALREILGNDVNDDNLLLDAFRAKLGYIKKSDEDSDRDDEYDHTQDETDAP